MIGSALMFVGLVIMAFEVVWESMCLDGAVLKNRLIIRAVRIRHEVDCL